MMAHQSGEVIIDGVRYVPAEAQPDEIKFFYMHDNCTFSRLHGNTIDEIMEAAEIMAQKSRCGMLCPPILMAKGKELRRLKVVAHAPCCGNDRKWLSGKEAWRKECESDSQAMRLLELMNETNDASPAPVERRC